MYCACACNVRACVRMYAFACGRMYVIVYVRADVCMCVCVEGGCVPSVYIRMTRQVCSSSLTAGGLFPAAAMWLLSPVGYSNQRRPVENNGRVFVCGFTVVSGWRHWTLVTTTDCISKGCPASLHVIAGYFRDA